MILYYAKKMCAFHKECKDHYNKYLCWLLFLDLEYLSLSPISYSHSTSWFIFIKTNSQITAKTIVLYEYKCNNNVAPDFILFLCGVFIHFIYVLCCYNGILRPISYFCNWKQKVCISVSQKENIKSKTKNRSRRKFFIEFSSRLIFVLCCAYRHRFRCLVNKCMLSL